ncbi:class I SAM-dependent RNA methyltransferase [Blastococcus sp. KM273128]|uniref:class I SAM-dependent RNA methyltransferase n=1 Tax=Blastococcus sp. KM273128 TaxID=2570314 RepID=UPI001F250F36|nr:TRAM domain-containing protein [Blastococcus sp. KM273128]MCF6743577.1 class I SAM-dependent RNA methyltransferase [Blastococcus sp. KM273128]
MAEKGPRPPRPPRARGGPLRRGRSSPPPDKGLGWVGREFEVEVGPVAHGGHCVARHEGRVVFVRHTLPGERVRVRVTEDRHPGFCRADAVEVLDAAPARVARPCPYSGPGKCGGCDWQHVDPAEQRRLKAAVVREQLVRLGGLDEQDSVVSGLAVEELPGGPLRWRSRARFAVDRTGAAGLRRHRSHDVVVLDDCPITVEPAARAVLGRRWLDAGAVDVSIDSAGAVTTAPLDRRGRPRAAEVRRTGEELPVPAGRAERRAGGRDWEVEGTGFWQVHPAAADALVEAVTGFAAATDGETVLDLYAGAGLFGGALAPAVGAGGRVVCVEADPGACAAADANLADLPQAEVWQGEVDADGLVDLLAELGSGPDVVVLDPPRAGAGTAVSRLLAGTGARAVVYVACDPAALGRDVAAFAAAGYRLAALRGFDAFPMTAHVECVALLVPA